MNVCDNEKVTLLMVSHDNSLKKYFNSFIDLKKLTRSNENTF